MKPPSRVMMSVHKLIIAVAIVFVSAVTFAQPPGDPLEWSKPLLDSGPAINYQRPEAEDKSIDYLIRATSLLVKVALLFMYLSIAWRMRGLEKSKRQSQVGGALGTSAPNQVYSRLAIVGSFVAGAAVTAVFSGSLSALTQNVTLGEVLIVGMIVPSLTWVIQLAASGIAMVRERRQIYWSELSRACLLGSMALLPAAALNMCWLHVPRWISLANVLMSVAIMATTLYRRTTRQGIHCGWPISWMFTITLNIDLFMWVSRRWWW